MVLLAPFPTSTMIPVSESSKEVPVMTVPYPNLDWRAQQTTLENGRCYPPVVDGGGEPERITGHTEFFRP